MFVSVYGLIQCCFEKPKKVGIVQMLYQIDSKKPTMVRKLMENKTLLVDYRVRQSLRLRRSFNQKENRLLYLIFLFGFL
ncbi:unnamed protein product [Adineta ricciae]|uniref:Uncharacterized protein n=1 Tax=Adineta ricciae TaxID=249248 RepID=A0A813RRN5_ADIRI|nr:unnamed protein product [Adineta ricciae]